MDSTRHVSEERRRAPTRRGFITALAGASAVPAVLAACGAPAADTGTGSTAAKRATPVTLRYAGPFTPGPANTFAQGVNQIIDAFNARGTNITVTFEDPKPLPEGVLAQVAGGTPPDLVHSHPRDYLPYADAVLGLDALMKQDKKVIPDIQQNVLDYWVRHGQPGSPHTGLPNNMSVQSIYFNKQLFAKHGVKNPDELEKEGKWNWDTYLDAARRITSGQAENKIWGAPWTNTTLDIQLGYIWPMGGDLWDKEVKTTLLDRKETLDAIQFQADLTAKYGVSPNAEEQKILSRPTGGALAMQRGGMEVLTNDVLALFVNEPFEKGMAPMPKGKLGRVIRGIAVGLGLIKDSKNQDAAWEYALYQAGQAGEQIMLRLNLTLPWRKSSANSTDFSKNLQPWESVAYYNEALKAVRPTVYPIAFGPIRTEYAKAYNSVRAGEQNAGQAIGAIKDKINSLLKEPAK